MRKAEFDSMLKSEPIPCSLIIIIAVVIVIMSITVACFICIKSKIEKYSMITQRPPTYKYVCHATNPFSHQRYVLSTANREIHLLGCRLVLFLKS